MNLVARTHRGRVRLRNEDTAAVDRSLGVGMVADGMGGLTDGHVASREAVAAALGHLRQRTAFGLPNPVDLAAALVAANAHLRRLAAGRLMGTTAVLLCLDGAGHSAIAHTGDSRAYLWHRGRLSTLTRDHSVVQELVDQGALSREAARRSPHRNVITRALGLERDVAPDRIEVTLEAGDLLLLCTDGLWDMLDDAEIAGLLAGCGPADQDLGRCADSLVQAALDAGGHDNVSVVLARTGN